MEFTEEELTDRAAALTCYAVLSIFPALIALVSIVGLVGHPKTITDTQPHRPYASYCSRMRVRRTTRGLVEAWSLRPALLLVVLGRVPRVVAGKVAAFHRAVGDQSAQHRVQRGPFHP